MIQQNIYNKDRLSIEVIADNFYKSKNYGSQFFKEHIGKSVKEYILNYKLSLVKNRLLYSDLTIAETSHEREFANENHLSKIFKKSYRQMTKQFKKKSKCK